LAVSGVRRSAVQGRERTLDVSAVGGVGGASER